VVLTSALFYLMAVLGALGAAGFLLLVMRSAGGAYLGGAFAAAALSLCLCGGLIVCAEYLRRRHAWACWVANLVVGLLALGALTAALLYGTQAVPLSPGILVALLIAAAVFIALLVLLNTREARDYFSR
jgi:hypothetical protein